MHDRNQAFNDKLELIRGDEIRKIIKGFGLDDTNIIWNTFCGQPYQLISVKNALILFISENYGNR